MKNQIFFKKIYLLLFILLFNCEKESDVENDTANNGIILSVQSFEEFPKLTALTQQVLKRGKDKINLASAKNADNLYDFSIDSTSIVQAAFEGSFWYTMKIYRDDYSANFFENLVVVDKKEEAPSAYLYKYFPDKAYLEAVEFDINTPFTGHVKHIPIDYDLLGITSRTACTTTTVAVCGNNGGPAGPGCSTNADGGAHVYSVTTTKCYSLTDYNTANTIDEGMSGSGGGANADGRIDEQPSTNDVLDADVITKPVRSLDTSSYNLLRANLGITDANQLRFLKENPLVTEWWLFYNNNGKTQEAKNELKKQMAVAYSLENRKLKRSTGKIANNDAFTYTHKDTSFDNGKGVLYLLESGLFLAEYGNSDERGINEATVFDQDLSLSHNGKFYYAYNPDLENDYGVVNGYSLGWYEVIIPSESTNTGFESALIRALWEGAEFTGRYILPIEDVVIMIDGRDFDGVEQSRVQAAGFFLVGLVPGGKVTKAFKPIAKIVSGVSEYKKIIKIGGKNLKLPAIKITGGVVDFGTDSANRSALRRVLQLTTGDGKHAHHIIPFKFRSSELVQKAAKSDKTFHISEKLNGIGLPSSNHLNGHNSIGGYNDTVEDVLNSLTTPNMSNELAYIRLKDFAEYLENLIQTNPNKNMGEIADLIDYGN